MSRRHSDKANAKDIGARIATIRALRGITQEALAGQIGLSRTQVVNVETGRSGMSMDTLAQVCIFLRCSADTLLFGKARGNDV